MKKLLLVAFSLVLFSAHSQSLNEELIVYYPFDGNAFDYSGNHFHGISNAGFSWDQYGNPEGALHFNGEDQYLDFPPNKPELKPPLPVSFSCWVLFEDISTEKGQVFTSDFDQNNYSGVWASVNMDGTFGISFGDGTDHTGPNNRRTKKSTRYLMNEQWYHIIGIIRGAEDMTIYINCMDDGGSYSGYGGPLAYTDCQGGLGRKDGHVYNPPYYFKGCIDDFRYWNRALTQENIDSLCLMVNAPGVGSLSNEIRIYPNPAGDHLIIENLPENLDRMQILDMTGRMLKSLLPRTMIATSELPPGNYFLRFISDEDGILQTSRFIIH